MNTKLYHLTRMQCTIIFFDLFKKYFSIKNIFAYPHIYREYREGVLNDEHGKTFCLNKTCIYKGLICDLYYNRVGQISFSFFNKNLRKTKIFNLTNIIKLKHHFWFGIQIYSHVFKLYQMEKSLNKHGLGKRK